MPGSYFHFNSNCFVTNISCDCMCCQDDSFNSSRTAKMCCIQRVVTVYLNGCVTVIVLCKMVTVHVAKMIHLWATELPRCCIFRQDGQPLMNYGNSMYN